MSRTPITITLVVAVSFLAVACGNAGTTTAESTAPSNTSTAAAPTSLPDTTTTTEAQNEEPPIETTTTTSDVDDGPRTVDITMTEFAFEPAHVDVTAGETVHFVITNKGVIDHEFRLSNEHRIEEHLASGHDDHNSDEGGHHQEDGDIVIQVEPGDTGELTVTFPEDTSLYTEIACLLPGHHEAGMIGDLTYSNT